ncbi:hypothetical protein TM57_00210 [Mycobacterium tuberculosis]|nr:hypothetical protein TM57_00210 [Mycobacterium tuberculosis]QOL87090.1 hypothetical protein FPK22_16285 [Mycobacterium tuberculosis]TXR85601.1 hypothetical protein DZD51_03575 [Mycobacterium tuberculosis]TXR97795.1 hypothetical protein DZD47_06785 [Mycobacterium tuberculosis]
MPIASAALAPGAAGRHHRAKCRSQARRLRRARRVGTIGLVPIASAALAPGAAGRHHRASADRKRGASAGRGGSAPSG